MKQILSKTRMFLKCLPALPGAVRVGYTHRDGDKEDLEATEKWQSTLHAKEIELVPMSIVSAGEEAAWTASPLCPEYTQEAAYLEKRKCQGTESTGKRKGTAGIDPGIQNQGG